MSMKKGVPSPGRVLLLILAYGLLILSWHISHGSVLTEEALSILAGQHVLEGKAGFTYNGHGGNPGNSSLSYADPLSMGRYGSPCFDAPRLILAALGDKFGGLPGARVTGVLSGIGLAFVMYAAGKILFSKKIGLFSAIIFIFSGIPLYLSKIATGDIYTAFLLGSSFLLILFAGKQASSRTAGLLLAAGSEVLFVAVMTRYTVAIFGLPLFIYVFWRHGAVRTIAFFLLPLSIIAALTVYFSLLPPWETMLASMFNLYRGAGFPLDTLTSRVLQFIAMHYLLAVFGMFHAEGGRTAILLAVLSLPMVLLQVVSNGSQAIAENMIYCIVFLTPAAALGVDKMGILFSTQIPSTWVRPFFTTAIFVVLWVFGLDQLRWLERQHPDMSPVFSFLMAEGSRGMTVTIGSERPGYEHSYRYHLERLSPAVSRIPLSFLTAAPPGEQGIDTRFELLAEAPVNIGEEPVMEPAVEKRPDFIILHEDFERISPVSTELYYAGQDYVLARAFQIPSFSGLENVKLFKRRLS